jgi:gamma-tubulin complex component 2
MSQVIEPRWRELEAALQAAATVDELLIAHHEFQHIVLKEILLTDPELLKGFTKIITVCRIFCKEIKEFSRTDIVSTPHMVLNVFIACSADV